MHQTLMHRCFSMVTAGLVAATLSAQPDHFTSSPNGFSGTEGGTSSSLIGSSALLRYQQIDATNYGSKSNRSRWAFRRDGLLPDTPLYGARNVELELVLAESNLDSISTTFANNYDSNMALVFTKKTVAFPDWTIAPAVAPANHDLVLFLDTMWTYAGKAVTGTDLLWEVRVYSNDGAGNPYPMDADLGVPAYLSGISTSLGTACVGSGGSSLRGHLDILSYGTRFEVHMGLSNGGAGNPAVYMIGAAFFTPLTQLGFCSNLEVLPLVTISLGLTGLTGSAHAMVTAPPMPALIGGSMYGQALVADPLLPLGVGLAQGTDTAIPANPPSTPQVNHIYALDPNATVATSGIVDGGIIALTNHP